MRGRDRWRDGWLDGLMVDGAKDAEEKNKASKEKRHTSQVWAKQATFFVWPSVTLTIVLCVVQMGSLRQHKVVRLATLGRRTNNTPAISFVWGEE